MFAADGYCFQTLEEIATWHYSKVTLGNSVLQGWSANHVNSSITFQTTTDPITYFPPSCDQLGFMASYTGITPLEASGLAVAIMSIWAVGFAVNASKRAANV